MLTALAKTKDGKSRVMVVIEPLSLSLLRAGKPITVDLNQLLPQLAEPCELVLSYTADLEGFARELVKHTSEINKQPGH
jgi:hypothetical protein